MTRKKARSLERKIRSGNSWPALDHILRAAAHGDRNAAAAWERLKKSTPDPASRSGMIWGVLP